jgi:5-methylthioadenosine/S-adenosylhomocysteine deaminase
MKSEDFYFFSLLNFLECVENGVTCINDMYFDTDQIIKAQKEIGIEQVTTVTLMNPDGDENGLKRMEAFRKCRENNPDSLFSIGIHGFYTTSPSYIKKCVEFAKEMNINLIHIHFCENDQEVADIKKIHNVSHPADALKNNFEGFKMVLAHSVILEEYDMKIMGEMNASISHNPISNCRLGCGFSDIVKLSKFGVNVALGTDGDGSSCSQSILKNARLACFLQKGIYKDPTLISAYEALKMATINGAKALGLEDKKGSIEIGKDADLNIINLYEDCLTFPVNDPVSDIIYNAEATNIETVIIKGKIIINNKQHTSINKKELFEKCLKLSNEIKSR